MSMIISPYRFISAGDPHWANVSLLLPMDTNFNDVSSLSRPGTAAGNAVISSAQSMFGGSSGFFDGTNDNVNYGSVPSNNVNINQDCTIEGWIRVSDLSTFRTILSTRRTAATQGGYSLYATSAGRIAIDSYNTSGATWKFAQSSTNGDIVANTWTSFAITIQGNTWRFFINGVLRGTNSNAPSGTYNPADGQQVYLGEEQNSSFDFHGYIDEFRFTAGVARYTASYTPAGPFPRSA
jgi:hypothetical protein